MGFCSGVFIVFALSDNVYLNAFGWYLMTLGSVTLSILQIFTITTGKPQTSSSSSDKLNNMTTKANSKKDKNEKSFAATSTAHSPKSEKSTHEKSTFEKSTVERVDVKADIV